MFRSARAFFLNYLQKRTRLDFNYSYCMKIEGGKIVPSAQIISALAAELDAGAAEALTLAYCETFFHPHRRDYLGFVGIDDVPNWAAMRNAKPIPAEKALQRLIDGNKRFVRRRKAGKSLEHKDSTWLWEKPRGPFAIILSCSDSRAPSEILFDQGLGDLFVIRVAGNIVAPSQVGSVEFAAATTKAQLVVVMGHSQCGAVAATLDALEGRKAVASTENLQSIVQRIRPHIEKLVLRTKRSVKHSQIWRDAVRANVMASTDHLRHGSRLLEDLVREGKLLIVGAEYCIDTGLVDFFDNPLTRSSARRIRRR